MHATLPDHPIPKAELDPPAIADIIDRAALLITTSGLHAGDWWPDSFRQPWQPGMPCDVTGAIGVAAGYRVGAAIDYEVVGVTVYDPVRREHVEGTPHPAFAALMRHLAATEVEQVFRWSDDTPAGQTVERLRACAAEIRPTAWVTV